MGGECTLRTRSGITTVAHVFTERRWPRRDGWFFFFFSPIFFLRWVSSVICVGRARGARPSSAPPPLSRPFWGKGEGHAARTYAKNIHHSWWIIRYPPHTGLKTSGGSGARLRAGTVSSYKYIYTGIYIYRTYGLLVPSGAPPVNALRANV